MTQTLPICPASGADAPIRTPAQVRDDLFRRKHCNVKPRPFALTDLSMDPDDFSLVGGEFHFRVDAEYQPREPDVGIMSGYWTYGVELVGWTLNGLDLTREQLELALPPSEIAALEALAEAECHKCGWGQS